MGKDNEFFADKLLCFRKMPSLIYTSCLPQLINFFQIIKVLYYIKSAERERLSCRRIEWRKLLLPAKEVWAGRSSILMAESTKVQQWVVENVRYCQSNVTKDENTRGVFGCGTFCSWFNRLSSFSLKNCFSSEKMKSFSSQLIYMMKSVDIVIFSHFDFFAFFRESFFANKLAENKLAD